MGFLDRILGKSSPAPTPAPAPVAPAATTPPVAAAAAPAEKPATAGGVLPQLAAARAKLDAHDLPGAMAIYEEVFARAGDRADVQLTASADLGTHGHVRELIELLALRYDAVRHGPGPGLNLLQAYLATRQIEAAQHVLDLLFSLGRPELEERLIGFSRALAELAAAEDSAAATTPAGATTISLVSISQPIWFYGLESAAPGLLPPAGPRLRRVAFGQCALLGQDKLLERAAQPEEDLGRFSRGLALWFAETFRFSSGYEPFAGIGVMGAQHYALFPVAWTAENVRQLNDSTEGGLDYVVTSELTARNADFQLTLRIWEVKKFRQLKAFTTRWTPADADRVLAEFHQQFRTYMEWTARPAGEGLPYAAPAAPLAHVQALGASLGLFLAEKQVLAPAHAPASADLFLANARANPDDARAQLTLVTALQRLQAQGATSDAAALEHARTWLAGDAAQAAGLGGVKL